MYKWVKKENSTLMYKELLCLLKTDFKGLDLWVVLNEEESKGKFLEMSKRYPNHKLIPFAKRLDNDDVSCYVENSTILPADIIVIIHDYANNGWEIDTKCKTTKEWFNILLDDMFEFC